MGGRMDKLINDCEGSRVGSNGLGKAWWTIRFGLKINTVDLGTSEPYSFTESPESVTLLWSLPTFSTPPNNADPEPRMNSDKWIRSRKLRGPSKGGSNKYQKTKSRCWQSFSCPKSYLHKFPKQSPSSLLHAYYTVLWKEKSGDG